jgi:hypothetical protein
MSGAIDDASHLAANLTGSVVSDTTAPSQAAGLVVGLHPLEFRAFPDVLEGCHS